MKKLRTLAAIVIFSSGCHAVRNPVALVPVNAPALESRAPAFSEEPTIPISEDSLLYDNSPELKSAMKSFLETGKAPVIKRAGFVEYPYGEVQPILNCRPNYGCDVQLQAGEKVTAVIIGDETMWDYLVWDSNQHTQPVSHITIGPRDPNARTNAIIGTDRRTYHLELLSTTSVEYVRSARFYYPRERLTEYQAREKSRVSGQDRTSRKSTQAFENTSPTQSIPVQSISFAWDIDAPDDPSWKPDLVFDDSRHIYLRFPDDISMEDLPGVYIPTDSGNLSQPNWRTVQADPSRKNILISGGTCSGKTTLAKTFIELAQTQSAYGERFVIIEDTKELHCNAPNVVSINAYTRELLSHFTQVSMRLRPDRVIGQRQAG